MLENEQQVLESMSYANTNLYFVPLVWAANLVNRARKEGHIKDDFSVKTLIDVCDGRLNLFLGFVSFVAPLAGLCDISC